ncbi:hypothetical protein LY76DRAFT_14202 [Colletotrichum caudatum]|nr:hypothetical protein LY76DRAFT_14202 [Colletotrichum caudatum]
MDVSKTSKTGIRTKHKEIQGSHGDMVLVPPLEGWLLLSHHHHHPPPWAARLAIYPIPEACLVPHARMSHAARRPTNWTPAGPPEDQPLMSELPRHACPFSHHGCESPNLEETPLRRLNRIKAPKKPQEGIDAALANQHGRLHRPKARVCLLHPVSRTARGWRAGWLGVVDVVNAMMEGRRVSGNVWPRLFWQRRPFFFLFFFFALISRPLARDCICASRTQPPRRQEMATKTKAAALQPGRE